MRAGFAELPGLDLGFALRDHPANIEPVVFVLLLKQDDPRKCTAAKMARLGLAKPLFRIRQIPMGSVVLNPFAEKVLLPSDRGMVLRGGLAVVDCSWERIGGAFEKRLRSEARRLPTLLAGNPVNYAKAGKLSSLEAVAAGLMVMGFKERGAGLLGLFKWGEGFLSLNREPLEAYAGAKSQEDMAQAEAEFF